MASELRLQIPDIHRSHSGSLSLSSRTSSYSPGKSPGLKSTRSRKGGFGDSGTLGSGGELPIAPELHVRTERELSDEINAIAESLQPTIDWEKRVHALLRLEGLVKGGVTNKFPNQFFDMLQSLHGLLAAQLQDRRSAVSRQACHVVSLLVESCGTGIESLVIGLQSPLLKAPGMSIQIVTEAAEACFRAILRYCPSARLLPQLFATVRLDKNVKLRQFAAEYILQALQEWEPVVFERSIEALEEAILAAASDATAETREAGRSAFVAYYAKKPAAARMMLMRLPQKEYAMKEKLTKAVDKVYGQDCFKADVTATISLTRQLSSKSSTTATANISLRRPPSPNINARPSLATACSLSPAGGSASMDATRASTATASATISTSAAREAMPPPTTLGKALRVPKVALPSPRSHHISNSKSSSKDPTPPEKQLHRSRSTPPGSPPAALQQPPTTQPLSHQIVQPTSLRTTDGPVVEQLTKQTPRKGVVSMLSNAAATVRRTLSGKASPSSRKRQQEERQDQAGASTVASMCSIEEETVASRVSSTAKPSWHRKSLGGALRIASVQAAASKEGGLSSEQQQQQCMPTPFASATSTARRVISTSNASSLSSSPRRHPSVNNPSPRDDAALCAPSRVPFTDALIALSTTKPLWSKKVSLFESIQGHLEESVVKELTDNTPLMNRFVDTLLDGASDAHFKVASAALSALIAALRSPLVYPNMISHLEFIVPALFARISDGKEHIRQLIGAALSILPHAFDVEHVVHGLVVTVGNAKNPKTLCAVMEYFAEMAGDAIPGRKHPADATSGKSLLATALSLAAHKNPDVRQSALGALAAVYSTGHAADIESAISALPSSPQAMVTRALAAVLDPAVQQLVASSDVGDALQRREQKDSIMGCDVGFVRQSSGLPSSSSVAMESPSSLGGGGGGIARRKSSSNVLVPQERQDSCALDGALSLRRKETAMVTTPISPGGLLSTPRPTSSMTRRLQHHGQGESGTCQSPMTGAEHEAGDASVASWQSRPFSSKYNRSPPPCLQLLQNDGDGSSQCLINSPGSAFLLSSKNLPQLLVELRQSPTVSVMRLAPGLAHGLGEKEVETLCSAVCDGLLKVLRSGMDDRLQEAALEAFMTLCSSMSTSMLSKLGPLLIEQLIRASTRGQDVACAADSAGKALMSRLDPVKGLSMIIPHMPEVDQRPPFDGDRAKSVLQIIKMLLSAIQSVTASQLKSVLGELMPSLSYCYSSANAEIRKTSVACIVQAHQIVGEKDMAAHLTVLTMAQQKLVSLYIERAPCSSAPGTVNCD